jgi:NAD(P)-dependent dehydrogenase (short-subunit alcohol dehydrogenase family)
VADRAALAGGRIVVTGATSGLGMATARHLAGLGSRVVLCGRTAGSAAKAADDVRRSTGAAVETAHGNLEEQAGVAALAAQLRASGEQIDVLVHNAGAAFPAYLETADGIERTVAVNHVAPLLLTELLDGHLAQQAVVLAVTSRTVDYVSVDEADPDVRGHSLADGYTQLGAYGVSKLLFLLAVRSLARRDSGRCTAVLFDPGGIQTEFAEKAGDEAFREMTRRHWEHMNTAEQAAADLVTTLTTPSLVPGTIYSKGGVLPPPAAAERSGLCDLVRERTVAAFAGFVRLR